jgi:hypothetical protein
MCKIAEMFAKSNRERSSSLSHVRFVTVGTGQFVYYGQLVFVSGVVVPRVQESTDGVVGGLCNSDCGVLEQFRDVFDFFSNVSESGPFGGVCGELVTFVYFRRFV